MKILIFLLGTIVGSFLNVNICRIPNNKSIVFPPSHCPSCKERLRPYDLIPIVSFLFLGGKCRYCKVRISFQYPIIEFTTGVLFLILYRKMSLSIELVYYLSMFSILTVIFLIDIKYQIIPNRLVLLVFLLVVSYNLIFKLENLRDNILGLGIGGLIFLLIIIISKGGMGFGDLKLIAVLGFDLGKILALYTIGLSFFLGGLVGLFLIFTKLKSRKDYIAFGPFIISAYFIVIMYGEKLEGIL